MHTHRNLLAFALILTTSCMLTACQKDERALWFKFQANQETNKASTSTQLDQRSPAQSAPRCFKDRFQETTLRQDIQKLESEYADGKVGDYTHGDMHFSGLPQATIDELSHNYRIVDGKRSKTWTAISPKQASCKDYACFVSSLYENPSHEGLVSYWYFLKTGYRLAATDEFSWVGQNGQEMIYLPQFTVEQHLFDKRESQALWLQAQMLPKSMLHLQSLGIIQRLPHGYIPAAWLTGVCGHARGNMSGGEILLSDECLTLAETDIFDYQYFFYHSVTHEIAHRLSNAGAGTARPGALSYHEDPAFMALSQWRIERLPLPNGNFSQKWANMGGDEGWQSGYAKTSPGEDFAEMVSLYRNSPYVISTQAPKKYEYAKKIFFDNHGFTEEELRVDYTTAAKNGVIENADQWLTPCIEGKSVESLNSKLQALAKKVSVSVPVDSKTKACIQTQVIRQIAIEFDRTRFEEPEGCAVIRRYEMDMNADVIAAVQPDLDEYFKSYEKLTDLMSGVKEFRAALAREYDARVFILACSQNSDARKCYESKLQSEFERLYQKFRVLLSVAKTDVSDIERKRFLNLNGYAKAQLDVTQFYETFFAQFNENLTSEVDLIWSDCITVKARANTDVLLAPYTAGIQYVSPAVIQCLNERIPEVQNNLRTRAGTAQGVSVFSNEAKLWINDRVLMPKIKMQLDAKVLVAAKLEGTRLEKIRPLVAERVSGLLDTALSLKNSSTYSLDECLLIAIPTTSEALDSKSYQFISVDSVVREIATLACERSHAKVIEVEKTKMAASRANTHSSNVSGVPPVGVTSAQKRDLDSVWMKFKPLFLARGETRFERCRAKIYFTSRLKRNCLYSDWDTIVQEAIQRWIDDPEVSALMNAKKYSAPKLRQIAEARVEDESQILGDALVTRFYEN